MRTFGIRPVRLTLLLCVGVPVAVACIPIVAGVLLVDHFFPSR